MKKIELFTFFALLSTGIAFSQPPGGGQRVTVEERAKKTTEWMITELELTHEQIIVVDSINLLFTKAQQSYIQAVDRDPGKVREAMITLNKEKEDALSKVLTESQMKNYRAKTQEMMNSRGFRGWGKK